MVTGCWQALLLLTMPPAPIMYLFFHIVVPAKSLAKNEPLSCTCFCAHKTYCKEFIHDLSKPLLPVSVNLGSPISLIEETASGYLSHNRALIKITSQRHPQILSDISSNIVRGILKFCGAQPQVLLDVSSNKEMLNWEHESIICP